MFHRQIKFHFGLSLVETLISITIFLLIVLSVYSAFAGIIKLTSITKAKVSAWSLVNQKLEIIHNLAYKNVGTIGGIPNGTIPQNEDIVLNGINYHIQTTIVYYDDPADGISVSDDGTDTLPTDYKKVKIIVSWNGHFSGQVSGETTIAPPGLETDAGGGTLRIKVFNASGDPVPQAQVRIDNNKVDPSIGADYLTDNQGIVTLFGAPTSTEGYEIKVTKDGYSADRTYTTDEVANPAKPPASVMENQLTEISFSIDQVSQFNLNTKIVGELGTSTFPNASFTLNGSKTIGTDANNKPVLKFSKDYQSDENGQRSITDLEWDSYTFSTPSDSYLSISSTSPAQPIDLLPNTSKDATIYFQAQNSLLLTILNSSSSQPVFGATAHLYLSDYSYDQTQLTNQDGETEFLPLEPKTYNLTVAMTGYQTSTLDVLINGHTKKTIYLSPE